MDNKNIIYVPVYWTMKGYLTVELSEEVDKENLQAVYDYVSKNKNSFELPDGEYLGGSFEIGDPDEDNYY